MCEYVEFLMYLDELKAISSNEEQGTTENNYQEQEVSDFSYQS